MCDGIQHCAESNEDELTCNVICPNFCTCKNVTAICDTNIILPGISKGTHILTLKVVTRKNLPLVQKVHLQDFWYFLHLDFSKCEIREINGKFNKIMLINSLDLSNNQVNYIIPDTFQNNAALQMLTLQENNLTRLDGLSFHGIKSLIHLNLSRNQIKQVEPYCFKGVDTLHIFDLSFNNLTSITENSIGEVGKTYLLILSGNKILELEISKLLGNLVIDNTGFCCILETVNCYSELTSECNQTHDPRGFSYPFCAQNKPNNTSYGQYVCRKLIHKTSIQYFLWATFAFGVVVNLAFLVVKIIPSYKSELAIFNECYFVCNIIKCSFILFVLLFNRSYSLNYSYLQNLWKESTTCFSFGVMLFVCRHLVVYTAFGQVIFYLFVVKSLIILKPGQNKKSVWMYQLIGIVFWLSAS